MGLAQRGSIIILDGGERPCNIENGTHLRVCPGRLDPIGSEVLRLDQRRMHAQGGYNKQNCKQSTKDLGIGTYTKPVGLDTMSLLIRRPFFPETGDRGGEEG